MKKVDPFRNAVEQTADKLIFDLKGRFVPIPEKVCECGKPVVFPYPEKSFECSRCGLKWKLNVEIKKIS